MLLHFDKTGREAVYFLTNTVDIFNTHGKERIPMAHDHHHKEENIKAAFLLNLSFTILEIFGGLWTNSMAILSDAVHDLGDSIALGGAWYLENYSKKKPDGKFSFGYARFSLLAALMNSVILVVGSVLILLRAFPRIINPQEVNPQGMLVFAVLGILINGAAVLRMRGGTSLNERVVSWHLLEDVLGWAVILVSSIILMFFDVPVLDPILSVFITLYVLYNVIRNLKEILYILLQGVPRNFSIQEIEQELEEKTEALSVHHTHLWSLEGEKLLLSTHVVVPDSMSHQEIIRLKNTVREILQKKGIGHITVEVDYLSEEKEDCYDEANSHDHSHDPEHREEDEHDHKHDHKH